MLKIAGLLIMNVALAGLVLMMGLHVPVYFHTLFPALMLCLIFMMNQARRPFLYGAAGIAAAVFCFFFIRNPSSDILLLGIGQALVVFIARQYLRVWRTKSHRQSQERDDALAALEALKKKHLSRLESLHHLEKQVAGLLDLFESARDLNDCLSFDELQKILLSRVMPQMPFQKMRLIVMEKAGEPQKYTTVTVSPYTSQAVTTDPDEVTHEEKVKIQQLQSQRKMMTSDRELLFPLISDSEVASSLIVHGSAEEDLAKFEVLAAYLALQVKKIRLYETVKDLSIRDSLTGVFVRRHFLERFEEELKRSIKHELPMAVLMLDIDHFKRYNDAYGHIAGDSTLKQVTQILKDSLRKLDIVGRYGGEEFIIIVPEARRVQALEVAERIRSNVARYVFKIYNDNARVTCSIGAALFPDDVANLTQNQDVAQLAAELIQKADQALYRAKEEGRNRVILFCDL